MINNLSFQYPIWFFIFCLALGGVYTLLMYYKDNRFDDRPSWVKRLLGALRFLSAATISFMLLSPLLKSTIEDQKDPIVIFAEDRSQSIASAVSEEDLSNHLQSMNRLKENIGNTYQVVSLTFGEQVTNEPTDSFKAKVTNLSNSMQHIYDNYDDQNIGAIVLVSDGIYNEGKNPIYENVNFKSPLYTVGIGDTTLTKDLSIKNLLYNRISYLGDQFPLQIDLSAYQCIGNSRLRVRKHGNNQSTIVHESNIKIDRNNFFSTHDVLLKADESGVVRYSVSVSPIDGEENTSNNVRNLYVEILDTKQKILLLADGPHPDIAALKNLIEENKNYEVESQFIGDGNIDHQGFDLVVLHNLPSIKNDIGAIIGELNKSKTPRLFIAGTQVVANKFNAAQDVIDFQGSLNENEEVEAMTNTFSLFALADNDLRNIGNFGPIVSSFGKFEAKPTSNVLLYQKIKKIQTKYPLLAFNDINGIKSAVFTAEGIWKWRLQDYATNKNYETTSDLINKTIQYLTVKEDRRKFRVNLASNVYKDNEQISFDAQLYNNTYQLDNEPDVSMVVKDQEGKEFKYSFSKYNNYYALNVGLFPEGRYSYTANTVYNGEALTTSGKFNVESIELEQFDLTARFDVLRSLSEKFNGKTYTSSQLDALGEEILSNQTIKPVVYESSSTKSIIHNKWLFFLMFLLLGLEWFFRRYYGSY